jgi:hypothetical protein
MSTAAADREKMTHSGHRAGAQHLCGEIAEHWLDHRVRRSNRILWSRSAAMSALEKALPPHTICQGDPIG